MAPKSFLHETALLKRGFKVSKCRFSGAKGLLRINSKKVKLS
jgi:hypothetical protein